MILNMTENEEQSDLVELINRLKNHVDDFENVPVLSNGLFGLVLYEIKIHGFIVSLALFNSGGFQLNMDGTTVCTSNLMLQPLWDAIHVHRINRKSNSASELVKEFLQKSI